MLRKSKARRPVAGEGESGESQVGAVDGCSHDLDYMNCIDCSLDSESWVAEAVNNSADSAASSNSTVPTQLIILAKIRAGDREEGVGLYHGMHSQLVDAEEAEVKTSYCLGDATWKAIGGEAPEYKALLSPSRDLRLASSFVGNYSNVSVALRPIEKQSGCYFGHSFGLLYSLSAFAMQKALACTRVHCQKWQDTGSQYLAKVLTEMIESCYGRTSGHRSVSGPLVPLSLTDFAGNGRARAMKSVSDCIRNCLSVRMKIAGARSFFS